MLLLVSLRGNIFIYQGEELGLTQAEIDFGDLQDPEAIRNWPHTLGRDGARAPIPWDASQANSGFSACEPWLPMPEEYSGFAVAQQGDGSLLERVRGLIKLRQSTPALRFGDTVDLEVSNDVLRFSREFEGERVSAIFNLSDQAVPLSPLDGTSLLAGVDADGTIAALPQTLSPFSGVLVSS